MSEVIDIVDHEELIDLLAENKTVVVKFWATWCGPCRAFAPAFDAASEAVDATFVAVDVDKSPWAMVEYDVRGVPSVKMFQDGEFVRDVKERTAIPLINSLS